MHSLRVLLTNLIDYAGLFPPASLALDRAIRNYADYQRGRDSWMLGRFICPTGQLSQLEPYLALFDSTRPLPISALGAKNVTASNFFDHLQQSLTHIVAFRNRSNMLARVGAFELTLPIDITEPQKFLEDATVILDQVSLPFTTFYEIQLAGDWQSALQAINQHNAHQQPLGVKLRCGGITAEAFPPAAQVAEFINTCSRLNLPLKFTAGLHHPIRRYDESVQTKMFGFINVFTASLIAYANQVEASSLETILVDEDANNFHFSDTQLAYGIWQIESKDLAQLRQGQVLSFGSCSFDEPREDLRALGWLDS